MPADSGFRPFWSGAITFGLVSVPVALLPANRPRSVSLRMVDEEGTPLQRKYVCSKDGQDLDWDEIIRGYEIEKDRFVEVTDDELEAVEPRKSREIDLRLFADRAQIRPIYFERAYFLVPAGGSNKAYRLLAEVMEKTGRAGIASFVMRAKEYLVAILAENGILRAETLRFSDEIRTPSDVDLPEPVKPRAATVKKFEQAITKLKGKVDFSEMIDDSAQRLLDLVEAKAKKGEDVVEVSADEAEPEEGGEVIDLMAVLRRSLGGTVAEKKPARRAPKKGSTKKAATKKTATKKTATKKTSSKKRATKRALRKPAAKKPAAKASRKLDDRTRGELMEQARRLDIAGRSGMTKGQLAAAIRKSA